MCHQHFSTNKKPTAECCQRELQKVDPSATRCRFVPYRFYSFVSVSLNAPAMNSRSSSVMVRGEGQHVVEADDRVGILADDEAALLAAGDRR